MEKTTGDAIIIEQPGMKMSIEHRHGLGGKDEGLTFDVTTTGADAGKRIVRFDCFYKDPHYHIGMSGDYKNRKMKDEGIDDPVGWTLEQLKTSFPSLVRQAGYGDIAATIDQLAVADQLTRMEAAIRAKY
ncbi:MAG TPA: hypothetical protein VGH16_18955 [Candidatus Binatia bacterium]|jgi:hypothetical protein